MRIVCTCGRNLADATVSDHNPDWVWPINHYLRKNGRPEQAWRRGTAALVVVPRSGVEQHDYETVERAHTYTWACRCRQNWTRTAEKVALAWADGWARPGAPWGKAKGVIRVVLDTDL